MFFFIDDTIKGELMVYLPHKSHKPSSNFVFYVRTLWVNCFEIYSLNRIKIHSNTAYLSIIFSNEQQQKNLKKLRNTLH